MELMTILIIIILVFPALLYKVFEDAGKQSWQALMPVYNYYVWIQIIDKKWWWFALMFVPFINMFMIMLMIVETVKCYGKNDLGNQALAVLFPFAYLPWIGFSADQKYTVPSEKIKKSVAREWIDAIIFAVVAALN